ncbi:MAG: non-ribosomal peptide synthetase, partial [Candidatus Promineifilaceae bacterium]
FSEVLARARHVALGAYEHQDIPFEKLLEELQPERELNRMPLFQTLLVLQNAPSADMEMAGIEIEPLRVASQLSKLDLSLYLTEVNNGLRARFEYSTDLFNSDTIERLASHLRTLLESVVADPDTPISKLNMIRAAERALVLDTWNQTGSDFGDLPDLVSQFYSQAAARPDQAAFLERADRLTYHELNQRSNQLAQYLFTQGSRPGERIGVCLARSLDVPVALLAILKLGGVYLPLDPSYPAQRLRYMLEDAGATAVITTSPLLDLLHWGDNQQNERQVICLDTLDETLTRQPSEDMRPDVAPEDPAYIIYTSGSTGQPKGVLVPHRQILNRLAWMWQSYPFDSDEVGCQKTALSFVDSLWELLGYLLQGVPAVILPDETVRDPHLLVEALAAHHVSRLWLVPSLLRAVLDAYPDLRHHLPRLRFWVSSGEALTTTLYRRFEEAMPLATLYNLYGTSELWDVTWFDPGESGTGWPGYTVPIGRAIFNTRTVILDAYGRPVPIGVTGELCVGGAGLADGYIHQSTLGEAKFSAPPWMEPNNGLGEAAASIWHSSDRIYHTGDLARWLSDGNIEFMGRVDRQVKLRGQRIELEEIETYLTRHHAIRQSVAAVADPGTSNERLVAYCVPLGGATPTASELSGFLRTFLPASMIPSSYFLLDALPLTPSGKIDRKILDRCEVTIADREGEYVAPRTPTEQQLTAIWERLLNREVLSVHDSFFEVGGHSLLGIQLFARIEEEFGRRLPLGVLFTAPTIAQLASQLDHPPQAETSSTLVPIQQGNTRTPFFCVHGFGGGVLGYSDLSGLLGPEQPFFGLQAAGLSGDETADDSIEKMAERYVAAMRHVQPSGPYLIGGYCFGGVVAFEMARQLEAVGESVPVLAIMEGYAPKQYQHRIPLWSLRRWHTVWQNIPYWLEDYWSLGLQGIRLHVERRGRIWTKQLLRRMGKASELEAQDLLPDDLSVMPQHHRKLMETHLLALGSYAPAPIKGRIMLFAARGKTINTAVVGSGDPEHGWGALA